MSATLSTSEAIKIYGGKKSLFGSDTKKAVENFQKTRGLIVDGVVGSKHGTL